METVPFHDREGKGMSFFGKKSTDCHLYQYGA